MTSRTPFTIDHILGLSRACTEDKSTTCSSAESTGAHLIFTVASTSTAGAATSKSIEHAVILQTTSVTSTRVVSSPNISVLSSPPTPSYTPHMTYTSPFTTSSPLTPISPVSTTTPLSPYFYWPPIPYTINPLPLSPPHSGYSSRRRKARTVFTDDQMDHLEKSFQVKKYLSIPERITVAKELGLSEQQVKTWFQNRRTKWKRQVTEQDKQEALDEEREQQEYNDSPPDS